MSSERRETEILRHFETLMLVCPPGQPRLKKGQKFCNASCSCNLIMLASTAKLQPHLINIGVIVFQAGIETMAMSMLLLSYFVNSDRSDI